MADIGTAYFRVAPNMTGVQGKIASGLKGSGSAFGEQFGKELGTKSSVIFGAIAGITMAATQKAVDLISSSVSDAVRRVDILNNFPKVMSNMGISFEDAAKASEKLDKGLRGLPTTLDTGTLAVQRLTTKTQDIDRATKIFLALNNAILAGGAPMELQANATEQFAQAFAKGKPDMMEWRSILSTMPAQISQVAKQLGQPSVDAFGEQLRKGEISMESFADALIALNTQGVAGLPNLQQQAKNATAGIGTSMQVMKTAITRGLADIMKAVGTTNIADAIVNIGKGFESALKIVSGGIRFVAANGDVFAPIAIGIGSILTVMTAWAAITKTMAIAQGILNAVLAANPVVLITYAIIGLVAALTYFFTQTETGKKLVVAFGKVLSAVWLGIQDGIKGVGEFFTKTWASIKSVVGSTITAIVGFWNSKLKPVFDTIIGILGVVMGVFIKVFAFIALVVLGTMAIIAGAIGSEMQKIWGVITTVWNAVYGVVSKVLGIISDRVVASFNFYLGIITTILNAVLGVFKTVWNAIYSFVAPIVSTIAGVVTRVFTGMWNTLTGIWNSIFGTVSSSTGRISDAVTGTFNRLVGFVGGIGGRIISALGNMGGLLYNAGRDLINGLINGASSLLGSIGKFFLDKLPGWIQGPFKSALGIKSPSKVFAGYGENIGEGLVGGLNDSKSMIKGAVNDMTSSALAGVTNPLFNSTVAFSSQGALGQGPATGGNSQSVTIGTVVLNDQTAVKEFFKQLNQDTIKLGMGLTPNQGAV